MEEFFEYKPIVDPYSDEYKYDNLEITRGSTKMHDYFDLVRSRAIEEIKKVRDENLQRYDLNREKYKYNRNELTSEKVEEMRRELFKEKFCFLLGIDDVVRENEDSTRFKCIEVITDFYLDTYDQHKLLK